MQHKIVMTLIALSMAIPVFSQSPLSAKISAKVQPSSKQIELISNTTLLSTQLKPRSAVAMATQKPFIKHFWEFGDGSFSLDEKPLHNYLSAGNPKARLFMTPCYTLDIIKPDSQTLQASKSILASKSPESNMGWSSGALRLTSNLSLHNIKAVRANDVFVAIASFRNTMSNTRNAKLFIFYNKIEQMKTTGKILSLKDARLYDATEGVYGQELGTVNALKKEFYDVKTFKISELDTKIHNLFMTFEVAEKAGFEKIKDLDIVAALVFDGAITAEQSLLSFKTASSFDPNNIKAPGTMSFRGIKKKTFKYRINFENIGNSPATTVKVKTTIAQALNAYSIQNIKASPAFKVGSAKDSALTFAINPDGKFITFTFSNIDLSGAKEDWGPKKKDSQGYIEYELIPQKGIKKRTIESGAEIVFDQNAPIIADKDRTPFRNGISLGVKAGMNYQPNTEGGNYFIGATYSAYRPAGIYLQMEAMVDVNKRTTARDTGSNNLGRVGISALDTRLSYTQADSSVFYEKYNRANAIRLVPAHLRYDITPFCSIGLGVSADLTFSTTQQYQTPVLTKYRTQYVQTGAIITTLEPCRLERKQTSNKTQTKIDYAAFVDLTFGNFSHGFSAGLRAIQPFQFGSTSQSSEVSKPSPKMVFQFYVSKKIL
jgi:hypothetical protein